MSKTGPGKKVDSYTFDALDRLVGISAPGSEPERYLYNADRQRVATIRGKDGAPERYIHRGRSDTTLVDIGAGGSVKRYVGLPNGQLLLNDSGGHPQAYHHDAIGNTVALSENTGRISARLTYDPYGARNSIPKTQEVYGYVGEWGIRDLGNGLLGIGVRDYDVSVGRFTSRDPIREELPGVHPYAYVSGNPVCKKDPSGLVAGSEPGDWCTKSPELWFSQVCQLHDRCYESPTANQAECDSAFYFNALAVCEKLPLLKRIACVAVTQYYWTGIKLLGGWFFPKKKDDCQ